MESMESVEAGEADAGRADGRMERAEVEAHNAVQWLARVARSYAPTSTDDITLFFDPDTLRVVTPEIASGTRLGLDLAHLIFQFHENGRPTPHALDVDDRSTTEIEAWLLAELLHRGFDRQRFDKHLPYAWPHPMSGDEAKYAAHDLADELERLAQRLAIAARGPIERQKITQEEGSFESIDSAMVSFLPRLFCLASEG